MPEKKPAFSRLLVVCRESAVIAPLWAAGESNGWELESASSGWGAMERVQAGVTPDLLILDVTRGDKDGLYFLRWLRRLRPELPIVVLGDSEDTVTRQEAIRLGARECLAKPFRDKALEDAIHRQLASPLSPTDGGADLGITSEDISEVGLNRFFVAASPAMRKLRAQVELLAETDAPVLIVGEKGSGKETTARLLHQLSVRSGFRFAKINCAALPSDLLEYELFGCDRTHTGGLQIKRGQLELCHKGTILLSEIGEMPMSLQAKLVQVMQSQSFARPGSGASVTVDVHILACSTNSLEAAVSDHKLREDLYYRLSTYTVRVPPLRERREEMSLLLHYFMQGLAKHYALSPRPVSPAVLESSQLHHWPGNLRELESFVKRLLLAAGQQPLAVEQEEHNDFALRSSSRSPDGALASPVFDLENQGSTSKSLKSLVQTVKLEAERTAIAAALERTGWNRKAASRLLKVSYRTLLYKIDQYQMRSPESALIPKSEGTKSNGDGFGGNRGPQ